jgi:hypothetical protein
MRVLPSYSPPFISYYKFYHMTGTPARGMDDFEIITESGKVEVEKRAPSILGRAAGTIL